MAFYDLIFSVQLERLGNWKRCGLCAENCQRIKICSLKLQLAQQHENWWYLDEFFVLVVVVTTLPISVFVKCSDAKLKSQLVPLTSAIATLAYCSKVDFDEAPPSSGCAILPVSDKCEVHLVLQVRKHFWIMNNLYSLKLFCFRDWLIHRRSW